MSVESLRTLPIEMLEQLLRESYLLVREKLPRRVRRELGFE